VVLKEARATASVLTCVICMQFRSSGEICMWTHGEHTEPAWARNALSRSVGMCGECCPPLQERVGMHGARLRSAHIAGGVHAHLATDYER